MLLKIALLLAFGQCFIAAVPITDIANLCTTDRTCYSSPDKCELSEDGNCDFVLSLSPTQTDFYINETNFDKYTIIYSKKDGIRALKYLLCYQGYQRCFMGSEKKNDIWRLEMKYATKMTVVDEAEGTYLYSFPRVVFETGTGVEYFYEKRYIGAPIHAKHGVPLTHLSGPLLTINLQSVKGGNDTKTLETMLHNAAKSFVDIDPNKSSQNGTRRNPKI
ncbi:unnamed protein product [Caenorhabditis angaria]|uniref:Uncharacterized protein n=1 Tax=Caenorhabditis angaria TaxID=860376 RepID=A0A9P1N9C3_9PELO|nr:unnamed protein product [Caenorhabditis angaria]